MSKPITEVFAALFWDEFMRLRGMKTGFADLTKQQQADVMSAMCEVTRTINAFGLEVGKRGDHLVLQNIPEKKAEDEFPRDTTESELNPTLTQGEYETASMMGKGKTVPLPQSTPQFTGRECVNPECRSLNTIPNGSCIICLDCHTSGECG